MEDVDVVLCGIGPHVELGCGGERAAWRWAAGRGEIRAEADAGSRHGSWSGVSVQSVSRVGLAAEGCFIRCYSGIREKPSLEVIFRRSHSVDSDIIGNNSSAATSLRSSRHLSLSPRATPAASVRRLQPSRCATPAASVCHLGHLEVPFSLSLTLRRRIHRSRACGLRPAAALIRRRDGGRRIALPHPPRGHSVQLVLPRLAPDTWIGADARALLLLSRRDGAAGDMQQGGGDRPQHHQR
jgi:hypothetical protein